MSTQGKVRIRRLGELGEREVQGLSDVLIDCVEGGDSIGFVLPMLRSKAESFWRGVGASLERGERVVLVAEGDANEIIGTVSVFLAMPENQPHRAELVKMQVHRQARRRGVGAALLAAAERTALGEGRTLLVLDTASADAERLYARHGWQRCGTIPNFALMPDGRPCSTTVFFKFLSR